MRIFRFKLTAQVMLESLESNAQTFGELKADIQNSHLADKINFNKTTEMRDGQEWVSTIILIDKNTKTEFGKFDDAYLPTGDKLIFFVLPFEHKGGVDEDRIFDLAEALIEDIISYEDLEEDIMEWGYDDLIELGVEINKLLGANGVEDDYDLIVISGKRVDILHNILSWYEEYVPVEDKSNIEATLPKNDFIEVIVGHLEEVIALLESVKESPEYCCVDPETFYDLHSEALELRRQLNS